ncbi:uncharacterized protein IWZ02DRAFT_188150 [Phyllosticta citriasiana]|uniref:uncharacterized protein n=1 Tax=Phyllosticta citriasiana TaxID=595635 RepID=UPI0030FD696C
MRSGGYLEAFSIPTHGHPCHHIIFSRGPVRRASGPEGKCQFAALEDFFWGGFYVYCFPAACACNACGSPRVVRNLSLQLLASCIGPAVRPSRRRALSCCNAASLISFRRASLLRFFFSWCCMCPLIMISATVHSRIACGRGVCSAESVLYWLGWLHRRLFGRFASSIPPRHSKFVKSFENHSFFKSRASLCIYIRKRRRKEFTWQRRCVLSSRGGGDGGCCRGARRKDAPNPCRGWRRARLSLRDVQLT